MQSNRQRQRRKKKLRRKELRRKNVFCLGLMKRQMGKILMGKIVIGKIVIGNQLHSLQILEEILLYSKIFYYLWKKRGTGMDMTSLIRITCINLSLNKQKAINFLKCSCLSNVAAYQVQLLIKCNCSLSIQSKVGRIYSNFHQHLQFPEFLRFLLSPTRNSHNSRRKPSLQVSKLTITFFFPSVYLLFISFQYIYSLYIFPFQLAHCFFSIIYFFSQLAYYFSFLVYFFVIHLLNCFINIIICIDPVMHQIWLWTIVIFDNSAILKVLSIKLSL